MERMLIVDDEVVNQKILANVFSDEYEIDTACDGFEACERVKNQVYSIIITDNIMPSMSGLEFIDWLRHQNDCQNVPVVFSTAYSDDDCEALAFEHGATDVIFKPFNVKVVRNRVHNIIRLRNLEVVERMNRQKEGDYLVKDQIAAVLDATNSAAIRLIANTNNAYRDAIVEYANDAYLLLHGYELGTQLVGTEFFSGPGKGITSDDMNRLMRTFEEAMKTRADHMNLEYNILLPDMARRRIYASFGFHEVNGRMVIDIIEHDMSQTTSILEATPEMVEQSLKEAESEKYERDSLTGLYVDQSFLELSSQTLKTKEGKIALLLLDLDDLTLVNERFGHGFGNGILETVSVKMCSLFGENDILGRTGGDEFAVLMTNPSAKEAIAYSCETLCRSLHYVYPYENDGFEASVSLGVVYADANRLSYSELYKTAKKALAEAKVQGKNTYMLYEV